MVIFTTGRGKKRKVHSFGAGSVGKQMAEMMCISEYARQCAKTMDKVSDSVFNSAQNYERGEIGGTD